MRALELSARTAGLAQTASSSAAHCRMSTACKICAASGGALAAIPTLFDLDQELGTSQILSASCPEPSFTNPISRSGRSRSAGACDFHALSCTTLRRAWCG